MELNVHLHILSIVFQVAQQGHALGIVERADNVTRSVLEVVGGFLVLDDVQTVLFVFLRNTKTDGLLKEESEESGDDTSVGNGVHDGQSLDAQQLTVTAVDNTSTETSNLVDAGLSSKANGEGADDTGQAVNRGDVQRVIDAEHVLAEHAGTIAGQTEDDTDNDGGLRANFANENRGQMCCDAQLAMHHLISIRT